MPQIRKMWAKKNTAIFVWPGEEPLEMSYNAIRIVVPARDAVSRVGRAQPYTHPAAILDGKELPGTALISDQIMVTQEGGYKTVLSIDQVCAYLTRDRDDLFRQGFNIVEEPEMVHEAMTLGIPLYAESQDSRAREVLARELQRQKAYKDRGEVPPPSLSEHLISWAIKHLQTRGPGQRAHSMDDIQAVLEGRDVKPTVASPPQAAAAVVSAPSGAVVEASQVFLEAQAAGVKLNGIEMANLLRGNEQTIKQTRLKIEAKRVEAQVPA